MTVPPPIMPLEDSMNDAVELLVIKLNKKQDEEISKVYVRQSDFNEFFQKVINKNPYFRALKWFIGAILVAFATSLIGISFSFYSILQNGG